MVRCLLKCLFWGFVILLVIGAINGGKTPPTTGPEATTTGPQTVAGQAVAEQKADPSLTWLTYLADCGLKAQEANEARSAQAFETKFKGRLVQWSGTVDHTTEAWFGKYNVFVRMDPTESAINGLDVDAGNDIILNVPSKLKSVVLGLNKGDGITFVGTLASQGGHFSNHSTDVVNLAVQAQPQPTKEQAEATQKLDEVQAKLQQLRRDPRVKAIRQ